MSWRIVAVEAARGVALVALSVAATVLGADECREALVAAVLKPFAS